VLSFASFCALFVDPCPPLSTLARQGERSHRLNFAEQQDSERRAEFETAPPAHCFATTPQQARPASHACLSSDVLCACFVILIWFPVSCICTHPQDLSTQSHPIV
jgi:hypothetical protein